MLAFTAIGLALNLFGTACAAIAFLNDWKKHRGDEPLSPWLSHAWKWLRAKVLRRRRPPMEVHHADIVGVTDRPQVVISGTVKPTADAPIPEQIDYLRREVDDLRRRLDAQRTEFGQRLDDARAELTAATAKAGERISAVEDNLRDVATGSVRLELVGLAAIGLGSVLSALPALFGWS